MPRSAGGHRRGLPGTLTGEFTPGEITYLHRAVTSNPKISRYVFGVDDQGERWSRIFEVGHQLVKARRARTWDGKAVAAALARRRSGQAATTSAPARRPARPTGDPWRVSSSLHRPGRWAAVHADIDGGTARLPMLVDLLDAEGSELASITVDRGDLPADLGATVVQTDGTTTWATITLDSTVGGDPLTGTLGHEIAHAADAAAAGARWREVMSDEATDEAVAAAFEAWPPSAGGHALVAAIRAYRAGLR